jgi:hypothetical protein
MKLTPQEVRTVELVEKALFPIKWTTIIILSFLISDLIFTWQVNHKEPAERRIVTMTQSDLREMIRQEIRK